MCNEDIGAPIDSALFVFTDCGWDVAPLTSFDLLAVVAPRLRAGRPYWDRSHRPSAAGRSPCPSPLAPR